MSTVALRGAVALVIVALPLGFVDVPGLGVSVVLVAMLVPAALAATAIVRGELRARPSLLLAGLLLGVVSTIVSSLGSADLAASVPLAVIAVVCLGYATAIVLAESDLVAVGGWLPLAAPIGGVIAIWALLTAGPLVVAEGGGVVTGRLQGAFEQPNELGAFCAALLPIGVIAVVTASTRIAFAIQLVATLMLGTAWVLSMSRGAWVGGCLALLVVAVFAPTTRRWLALGVAAGAGFVVAALAAPPSAGAIAVLGARLRSFSSAAENPYDARPAIWAEAWRQAGEHPWTGVGPGAFPAVSAEPASAVSAAPADHPHNLLLTVLVERGVLGVATACVLALGCGAVMLRAWQWYSEGHGLDSAWRIAAMAGLVALAGHGLFDMPVRNPTVAALTWTLLGYAAVSETGRRVEEQRAAPRSGTVGPSIETTWRYDR